MNIAITSTDTARDQLDSVTRTWAQALPPDLRANLQQRFVTKLIDAMLTAGLVIARWQPIAAASKRSPIIYWNSGGFVSSCIWRDADEGVQEGWWDDAITEYVEPAAYLMQLPTTPAPQEKI